MAALPVNDDWIIKGYDYLETLGEGSFAVAYRARHRKLRRDRVVKLLKHELMLSRENDSEDEDYAALFEQEAQALAAIQNENVPQVFDCGETDDGRPFIIMEFLNGKDLSKVIEDEKRTPFPVRTVLNLGICILDGLAAAHQVGIIHRDIKPANIFIVRPDQPGGSPKAKVTDLGSYIPIGKTEVRDGMVVCRGTARYAPPEQFTGQGLTTAADIYSVGVVLHEMLTGLFPFSWLSDSEKLAEAHATRPLRHIDTVRSDVPPSLIGLLDWFLKKDASERLSSAELGARKLRDLKDELDFASTTTRAATGRSIVVAVADSTGQESSPAPAATARFRSEKKELEPAPSQKKQITNSTDVDPEWWSEWMAEQAQKLGEPEPEEFVAQTPEDAAWLIDANRIDVNRVEPAARFASSASTVERVIPASIHTDPTAERVVGPSAHNDPTSTVRVGRDLRALVATEVVSLESAPPRPSAPTAANAPPSATDVGLGPVPPALEAAIKAASPDDSSENVFVDSPADAADGAAPKASAPRPSTVVTKTSATSAVAFTEDEEALAPRVTHLPLLRRALVLLDSWTFVVVLMALLAAGAGVLLLWRRPSQPAVTTAPTASVSAPSIPSVAPDSTPVLHLAPAPTAPSAAPTMPSAAPKTATTASAASAPSSEAPTSVTDSDQAPTSKASAPAKKPPVKVAPLPAWLEAGPSIARDDDMSRSLDSKPVPTPAKPIPTPALKTAKPPKSASSAAVPDDGREMLFDPTTKKK